MQQDSPERIPRLKTGDALQRRTYSMKNILLLAAALTLLPLSAHAQATPMATRGGAIQAGVGYTNADTDELQKRIGGASIWADFDLTNHIGLTGSVNLLDFETPQDYSQRSYEGGVRFIERTHHVELYGKVQAGLGVYSYTQYNYGVVASDSFGMFSLGGGVDYPWKHKIVFRLAQFEYQHWKFPPNNLTPTLLSFGALYRIR
jgi:hypothetical protein